MGCSNANLSRHRVFCFPKGDVCESEEVGLHCSLLALMSIVVVCETHFKTEMGLTHMGLWLIYNLLLLKTSVSLHIALEETAGSNRRNISIS